MTQKEFKKIIEEKKNYIFSWIDNNKSELWISMMLGISVTDTEKILKIIQPEYQNYISNQKLVENNSSFIENNYELLIQNLTNNISLEETAKSLKMTPSELNKTLIPYGIILNGMQKYQIVKDKMKKGSNGEQTIRKILNLYNISFKEQFTFSDCIFPDTKTKARFDFAVFENSSLSHIIEYDGEQHFKSVEMWGGEKGFEKRKEHDKIKNYYCFFNNIPLIRIPYDIDLDTLELEDLMPNTSWYLMKGEN